MIRMPVVSGQFYPASEKALLNNIEALAGKAKPKMDAIGVVAPHAGYVYSGPVAASVLGSIKEKPLYVIIGPNHTGLGATFSLSTSDSWKTPLGDVIIDKSLTEKIKSKSDLLKYSDEAHFYEHSIEVELPFLQFTHKDFKIVPVVVSYSNIDSLRKVGEAIASGIKDLKLTKDTVIIASSDMTHYESQSIAEKKDHLAIGAILKLDEAGLLDTVKENKISMCGWAPVAVMLSAAKSLGAKSAKLIKYQTSGDASGDYSSVVGYAGLVVY